MVRNVVNVSDLDANLRPITKRITGLSKSGVIKWIEEINDELQDKYSEELSMDELIGAALDLKRSENEKRKRLRKQANTWLQSDVDELKNDDEDENEGDNENDDDNDDRQRRKRRRKKRNSNSNNNNNNNDEDSDDIKSKLEDLNDIFEDGNDEENDDSMGFGGGRGERSIV